RMYIQNRGVSCTTMTPVPTTTTTMLPVPTTTTTLPPAPTTTTTLPPPPTTTTTLPPPPTTTTTMPPQPTTTTTMPPPPVTSAICSGATTVCNYLAPLWTAGLAAGNVGDWYSNNDGGHSQYNIAVHPQVQGMTIGYCSRSHS
ncbi:MAG: hypothetical protein V4736_15260, partial [Bdellovibrionota bacterium]